MTLSPQIKERLRKFRRSRRAWWSLLLLAAAFGVSLPAELLCNDKPYALKYRGRWYWPVLSSYTPRDFGLAGDLPVRDYRKLLAELAAPPARPPPGGPPDATGDGPKNNVRALFGDDEETPGTEAPPPAPPPPAPRNPAPAGSTAVPASYLRVLWPPIRYHAKTENTYCTTEGGYLISPLSYLGEQPGKRVPGAWQDGHLLGTDEQGRDVLARLLYGFRVSLLFGLALALTGTLIGCLLGGLQGYFGGWTDLMGQRATEIWGSMPQLFLLIILSSFLSGRWQLSDGQHFLLLFGILNLTAWMGMATYMRAQFLQARNLEYVKAAKALGQSNFNIMLHHILPNSLVPVVTFVPFAVTGGIAALVSLDFLGFGVKYPAPSLGDLLAQGQSTMKWWILLPTFLVISITLILLTFIGEGVRNAFDPRHKG